MLMSTGLTFGSISALYGLTNGIIDQTQYTILVTVVIGSAIVPTMIAQALFQPRMEEDQAIDGVTVKPTKEVRGGELVPALERVSRLTRPDPEDQA
jgi:hypothetical protein